MTDIDQLLEEYFDTRTAPDRRGEIKSLLESQMDNTEVDILLETGDWVKISEEEEAFRARIKATQKSQPKIRYFMRIAALIVLGIGIGTTVVMFQTEDPKGKLLYEEYFETYPATILRSDSTSQFNIAYQKKDYRKAIELGTLGSSTAMNDKHKILLGNAYLNLGEPHNALQVLQQVKDTSAYKKDADWFIALTWIKLDQMENALPYLQALQNKESIYQVASTELLEKINEP